MSMDKIGATAFIIAGVRALESGRETPLFSDPYAHLFVDDAWRERADQLLGVHFAVGDAIRLRTRAINNIVEGAIARGVDQIVNLGCGFDMRPAIYGHEGVRFFDVDQSPVLEFKASVLEKAGIANCSAVACDYLAADLPAQLVDSGLDPDRNILFTWEGNTMYLPSEMMFGFLERLCGGLPRFQIAFDYLLQSVLDGSYEEAEAVSVVADVQKVLGAKFQTGFDTLDRFSSDLAFRIVQSGKILEIGSDNAGPDANLATAYGVSEAFAAVYRIAVLER